MCEFDQKGQIAQFLFIDFLISRLLISSNCWNF